MINYLNSDSEMHRINEERKAFQKMIKESIEHVTTELDLKPETKPDLNSFYLVNSLNEPLVWESFRSTNPLMPVQLCIIQYLSEVHIGKHKNIGNFFR